MSWFRVQRCPGSGSMFLRSRERKLIRVALPRSWRHRTLPRSQGEWFQWITSCWNCQCTLARLQFLFRVQFLFRLQKMNEPGRVCGGETPLCSVRTYTDLAETKESLDSGIILEMECCFSLCLNLECAFMGGG